MSGCTYPSAKDSILTGVKTDATSIFVMFQALPSGWRLLGMPGNGVYYPSVLFGPGADLRGATMTAPIQIYGTNAVIIVTYVTLMIGHSTRLQFTTLVATGQEFLEASRACGAGPLRSLFHVLLPMCRKGIAATAALTFVLLFHEFSASLMVRSARTQVIGSVMYDVWAGGVFSEVAVLALIMVVVTVLGVLLAGLLGGSDSLQRKD